MPNDPCMSGRHKDSLNPVHSGNLHRSAGNIETSLHQHASWVRNRFSARCLLEIYIRGSSVPSLVYFSLRTLFQHPCVFLRSAFYRLSPSLSIRTRSLKYSGIWAKEAHYVEAHSAEGLVVLRSSDPRLPPWPTLL